MQLVRIFFPSVKFLERAKDEPAIHTRKKIFFPSYELNFTFYSITNPFVIIKYFLLHAFVFPRVKGDLFHNKGKNRNHTKTGLFMKIPIPRYHLRKNVFTWKATDFGCPWDSKNRTVLIDMPSYPGKTKMRLFCKLEPCQAIFSEEPTTFRMRHRQA